VEAWKSVRFEVFLVANLHHGFWDNQVTKQIQSLQLKKHVCNQHEAIYLLLLSLIKWQAQHPHFTLAIFTSNCRIRSNLPTEVRKNCASWHVWNQSYDMNWNNLRLYDILLQVSATQGDELDCKRDGLCRFVGCRRGITTFKQANRNVGSPLHVSSGYWWWSEK
jgi:hypothetical protein